MNLINLSVNNSIVNHYMSELRSVTIQNDPMRFRRNIERLGWIIGYEISKTLQYKSSNIQTPLGIKEVPTLPNSLVLATVLRAGLPFHQGFLDIFDHAENAFIAAYRSYKSDNSFGIFNGYNASPDISNKTLIIADPMLATGASLEVAYDTLKEHGTPIYTHIAVVIASVEGVAYLKQIFKNEPATLWCAAIDDKLSEKGMIIPGLGDAGDLAFGEKQS